MTPRVSVLANVARVSLLLASAALIACTPTTEERPGPGHTGAVICNPDIPSPQCPPPGGGVGQSPDGLFQLSCDVIAPIREASVTCTASNTDGSAPAVSGWTFTSDSLTNPVVRPAATASSTQWSGPVVVSGTVSVAGTVAGTPEVASVAIVVQPRDWSAKLAQHQAARDVTAENRLTGHPISDTLLGRSWLGSRLQGGNPLFVVGGPNDGLAVYDDIPILTAADVAYDGIALSVGSEFWQHQLTTGHCSQARVISIIPDIKLHEGFPPTNLDSHVAIFRASVDSIGARLTEGLLLQNGVRDPFDAASMIGALALQQSAAFDNDPIRNAFRVPDDGSSSCNFIYNY